jgi:hypothetical protein
MAVEQKTNSEIDSLAFEIYSKRMAQPGPKRLASHEALEAFKQAEEFVAVRAKVKSGALKTEEPDGPQLAGFCAPNLKRTNPHNLVSQRFGNLQRVETIYTWLSRNPTPENDPEDLVHRFNHQYPDLGWTLPEINVARIIFPAYIAKA